MSELATRPAPVSAAERIVALDLLRGIAVLGILAMNIQAFALPFAAYSNLAGWGEPTTADYWVWGVTHLFAEQKFMTLFSLLFGAGAALMLERLEHKGLPAAAIHYRRAGGLLLIGAAHAYLLWYGDILFAYAVCALLLYPLRRLRPKWLLVVGVLVLSVGPAVGPSLGRVLERLPPSQQQLIAGVMSPTAEQTAREIEVYRGGWWQQMEHRVPTSFAFETWITALFVLWRALGLMIVGMALYKWGVITAGRSPTFYRRLAAVAFGIGFPVCVFGMTQVLIHDFGFRATWLVSAIVNYFGSIGMSLGYLALVMLYCVSGKSGPIARALAAVGRMALTNYLLQTVLCISVFYGGFGLGLFARVSRLEQFLVVFAVWIFELLISPWWLARFRFGPAEWLWRTMTYLRPQPMRREAAVP